MSLIESILIPLGSKMPEFTLADPSGKSHNSSDLYGANGLLVAFLCNHCPYALAIWPRYIQLAKYARSKKINTIAVNPNINPGYPDDSPPNMLKKIKEWGIDFPYLVDEAQEVAKKFKAQCTPDLYFINAKHELVYHGRLDDNWQDETKVKRQELKEAIDRAFAGEPVDRNQKPSMGCSIKWTG